MNSICSLIPFLLTLYKHFDLLYKAKKCPQTNFISQRWGKDSNAGDFLSGECVLPHSRRERKNFGSKSFHWNSTEGPASSHTVCWRCILGSCLSVCQTNVLLVWICSCHLRTRQDDTCCRSAVMLVWMYGGRMDGRLSLTISSSPG